MVYVLISKSISIATLIFAQLIINPSQAHVWLINLIIKVQKIIHTTSCMLLQIIILTNLCKYLRHALLHVSFKVNFERFQQHTFAMR